MVLVVGDRHCISKMGSLLKGCSHQWENTEFIQLLFLQSNFCTNGHSRIERGCRSVVR